MVDGIIGRKKENELVYQTEEKRSGNLTKTPVRWILSHRYVKTMVTTKRESPKYGDRPVFLKLRSDVVNYHTIYRYFFITYVYHLYIISLLKGV